MTIETMTREFRYDSVRLPDPNSKLSIEEVRTAFSATYPEIATAAVTGPEAIGNNLVYRFAKAIGVKRRSYGSPVVLTVVGAAAALVPWSALAWLFIAD